MANTKIPVELSSTPGIVDNSNATAITIDSSENVGIGSTSPDSHLHLESSGATSFRIRTTSSSSEPQMIMIDGAGDYFSMQKVDRGMTFKPQGSEEVRIDADGLKFNGDTSASNALDDYEEGTWQAVHGGNNMTGSGYYVKMGSLVHFQGDWTSASGSTTAAVITGLPFNPSTSRGQSAFTIGYTTDSGGQTGGATLFSDTLGFYTNSVAQNLAAGERVIMQGTYSTAD